MRVHPLLPLLLLVARAAADATVPPTTSGPRPSKWCHGNELQVELPAPRPGGQTSAFSVRRKGEGMSIATRATCLHVGSASFRLEPGAAGGAPIAADEQALQRIRIGSTIYLVRVAPGDRIGLYDHPCSDYELVASDADPWFADPPDAYCRRTADQKCRPGFYSPPHPRPVNDDLCVPHRRELSDEEPDLRCVRAAHVTLPDGTRREIQPGGCVLTELEIGGERIALVVGVGDAWILSIDADGRVQGRSIAKRAR